MSVCEFTRNQAVESLHRGEELGQGLVLHMDCCEDCRLFVERTRRMSALVFADDPTAAEILRLRVRLGSGIAGMGSNRPVYRRRAPAWQVAFAGGVVLLSSTAVVAATGNGGRFLEAVGLKLAVEVAEPAPPPKPDRPAPVRRQVAPVEAPEPVVEQPAASASSEQPRSAPLPRVARQEKPKAEAKWADVAKSLRSKNYERAQRSLNELSQSGDAVERDTARLSLAQLWLQQGKTAQAQKLLRDLSASGASPFIRKRAGELLP